jgi:hypothetical protein
MPSRLYEVVEVVSGVIPIPTSEAMAAFVWPSAAASTILARITIRCSARAELARALTTACSAPDKMITKGEQITPHQFLPLTAAIVTTCRNNALDTACGLYLADPTAWT